MPDLIAAFMALPHRGRLLECQDPDCEEFKNMAESTAVLGRRRWQLQDN
jgi:hypothetical protein